MDDRFPFPYQIACVVLTGLFVLAFSISREPRSWRRLFQTRIAKSATISVNRNKYLDETLKKYSMIVAMTLLVADVACFVVGVTSPLRQRQEQMTPEERNRVEEMQRLQGNRPASSQSRTSLP
jgi:flagellar biosynthesis protein FlhB